ncbi:MAG: hypothetical protein JKY34_03145 [Kordiimonadaceae bacterium]|nr:hypothetical protein [Kordiimonadaceae bacterium]
MILDIVKAILLGAVPVALFTFLTLQWSIATGRLNKFSDKDDLKKQFKNISKARTATKAQTKLDNIALKLGAEPAVAQAPKKPLFDRSRVGDFFHNKVMSFGGGFYGTMALLTYVLIELGEILSFLGKLLQPSTWINNIGLDLLINFIINSIKNLIAAFLWFSTLPDFIYMQNGFIWLGAAYVGYLAGLRATQEKGDEYWTKLQGYTGAGKIFLKDTLKKLPFRSSPNTKDTK